MSNLKKVISLLLCLSMLAGMVAILDGAFVPTASAASAEPVTHKIKTMEQLNAEYGNKGFYYLGLEFYESNGKPTDGYVQPGDTLEVRVYVKSSFFMSKLSTHYVFENTFFDVKKNGAYETVSKAAVNPGYTVTPDSQGAVGLNVTQWKTEAAASNISYKEAKIGIPDATMENWDLCEINNLARNDGGTRRNFKLDQDKYIYSFNVTVKEGLADGTVGSSILTGNLFKSYERFNGEPRINANRKGDAYLAPNEATTAKNLFQFAGLAADCFDIADCNYTFVIGENPNPEGKYSANFIIRDTTDTKFYAPGESVAVPDAGADFLGWANVATGKVEDVTNLTMGDSNITYKAIYTTDTFDVTVDFDGGNVDGETSKSFKAAYGTTVDLTGITPVKAGYEFKGWNPATTTVDNINGITVKAVWSATVYSINFMIMDYKTGEWKNYDTKTGTVESKALTFASDLKKITNAVTGADVSWDGNATVYGYSYDKEYNEKIRNGDSIGFDGDKTVYIHTEIAYDVTLTIPVYDAATDSYVAPSEPQVKNAVLKGEVNTGKVGYTASAIQSILTPVEGFAFKQWVDNATGKKATTVSTVNNYSFNFTVACGPVINYTAEIGFREYELRFNMGNTYALASVKVSRGDVIDLSQLKFQAKGDASTELFLPEIGVEATQQKTRGWKDAGNVFRGWSWDPNVRNLKTAEDMAGVAFIEFPITVTKEFLKAHTIEDSYIMFYDAWEVQNYNINFYIITAESAPEYDTVPYKTVSVPANTNLLEYTRVTTDDKAAIDAKAPAGRELQRWSAKTDSGEAPTYMPASDLNCYAVYGDQSFTVYYDFNNGKPVKTSAVVYGADPEYKDAEKPDKDGPGTVIRRYPIFPGDKPGDDYEIIGWKVFYLDKPEDISDPAKWHEGYNSQGTQEAYSCLVYQAQWIAYKDLFFRVYDSQKGLYSALSKKFKTYYWNNKTSCAKGEGQINRHGSDYFILYEVELENWDWKGFFKPEMWQRVYLRYNANAIPKKVLTPEGFKELIKFVIDVLKQNIKPKPAP